MEKRYSLLFVSVSICAFILAGCQKSPKTSNSSEEPEMPATAPNYAKSSNDELAYLGRVLFYDKKLSSDNTVRCASCHLQSKAFADDEAFSNGVLGQKTTRNAPSIFPKNGKMFWDGRASNLGEMVTMPITNHVEMNIQNFDELCKKLSQTSYYPKLFRKAFNSSDVNKGKISAALREFVTNFDFSKNRFRTNPASFKEDELQGRDLFFGKAKCSECHHIDNNSSMGGPSNNGYGVTDESHNIGLDAEPNDKGVGDFTKVETDNGQFMMPVLLNVELTAPYMHDGRFATLEQVVEHYNSEVKLSQTLDWRMKDFSDFRTLTEARMQLDRNRDGKIDNSEAPNRKAQKLNLDETEKACLVKFLKTLTDKSIYTDTKFSDPFVH